MLLPKAFAGNKGIVKLTNISRDKEVWGDNASANGQVFESVLIPQHIEDDRKTPKLPSGWCFYYKVKACAGRTMHSPYRAELCPELKRKIIQAKMQAVVSKDLGSPWMHCPSPNLLHYPADPASGGSADVSCSITGMWWCPTIVTITGTAHSSTWQGPPIFPWGSLPRLLKDLILLPGLHPQCTVGACNQAWPHQGTASLWPQRLV